jgi:structural maintenance of chromosome 2
LVQAEEQARSELQKLEEMQATTSIASSHQTQRLEILKNMEKQLKTLQKQLTQKKNEEIVLMSTHNGMKTEIQALHGEMECLRESLISSEQLQKKYLTEEELLEKQLQNKRQEYENVKLELSNLSSQLNECVVEIKKLTNEREKKLKEIQGMSLECRKLTHKLECWKKDIHIAQRRVTELETHHPWILSTKQYFGLSKSDFDFTNLNLKECQERLVELKANHEKLSKKVNKKVMGMIDKAESESEDLLRKKEVSCPLFLSLSLSLIISLGHLE